MSITFVNRRPFYEWYFSPLTFYLCFKTGPYKNIQLPMWRSSSKSLVRCNCCTLCPSSQTIQNHGSHWRIRHKKYRKGENFLKLYWSNIMASLKQRNGKSKWICKSLFRFIGQGTFGFRAIHSRKNQFTSRFPLHVNPTWSIRHRVIKIRSPCSVSRQHASYMFTYKRLSSGRKSRRSSWLG